MHPRLLDAHRVVTIPQALRAVVAVAAVLGVMPLETVAQPASPGAVRPLSVGDAVALAHLSSDALVAARAGVDVAAGRRTAAGADGRPRVAAYSSFDRALRSEYQGLSLGGAATDGGSTGESVDLPFGSANTYRSGVTASQTIFAGGATLARRRAGSSAVRAAELGVASTRAELTLDVTAAYFDAALAEQLVHIVEATLAQADSTAQRAALVLAAGRGSEFDWLRAKVAVDRQRPELIRRRSESDVAMLRLRQLVHAAPGETLVLTTPLEIAPPSAVRLASFERDAAVVAPEPPASARIAVRAADEAMRGREQLLAASRAARWPTVSLTSSYERVAYPRAGLPGRADFRTNWTAGARVDVPLLTGGAWRGREAEAAAELSAARATLRHTEQLAELDTRTAASQLAAAEAAWTASEGVVREAARAYEIAQLRHGEGLAIQLELADARLALEEARAERARAARDVLVERLRATLLADLPLRVVDPVIR